MLTCFSYEIMNVDRLCCLRITLVFRNKDDIAKYLLGNEMLGLIVLRDEYQSLFRMQ